MDHHHVLASSSTCCRLLTIRARSATSVRRWRVRSRRARCGAGGIKRPRNQPCGHKSAIHAASFASVLRPGTALIGWAFTTQSSNRPASRLDTGVQDTPVLSSATGVQPVAERGVPHRQDHFWGKISVSVHLGYRAMRQDACPVRCQQGWEARRGQVPRRALPHKRL
jgi:hypothetical protein